MSVKGYGSLMEFTADALADYDRVLRDALFDMRNRILERLPKYSELRRTMYTDRKCYKLEDLGDDQMRVLVHSSYGDSFVFIYQYHHLTCDDVDALELFDRLRE